MHLPGNERCRFDKVKSGLGREKEAVCFALIFLYGSGRLAIHMYGTTKR